VALATLTVEIVHRIDPDDRDLIARLVHKAVRAELAPIKELLMSNQDDVLAQLAEVKALAAETQKDVLRVIAKLEDAAGAGDLSAVTASIGELKDIVQGTDDAAETADPEVVEPPAEDTPTA